jgi:putative ABC transport system permease protein
MKLLRYNLLSLGSRATTAITAALGVALVTMVLSGALMLGEGVRSTLLAEGDPDTAVVIRKGSDAELASGFATSATSIVFDSPGVRSAGGRPLATAEVVVVAALARVGAAGIGNVTLRGIDGASVAMRELRVVEGRAPAFGTDEAMVGARIAGRFEGLAVGERIELRHNRPLRIVGVFEASGGSTESEVWLDRALLEDAFGRTGVVSSARVALEPGAFEAFERRIESDRRLGLEVLREPDYLDAQSEGLSIFLQAMGIAIAILFAVAAMLGAAMTMHAAVAHRIKEIGVLRALGFSRRHILAGFLFESVALALAGGLGGAALSLVLTPIEISMINYATWSELVFGFVPTLPILLTALIFAAAMGVLGGFLPALRAARVKPVVAMRE